jgi:predicted RNase H-like nuclease (RuvC/YqgF family)
MAMYYVVYVNDPHRVTKPFYTNLGGKAIEIPVAYETGQQSGLYIGLKNSNSPQESQCYRFDELNDKLLDSIGIFKSKQSALESGNTERYLNSETRNKEMQKENGRLKETNELLATNLQKTEERATRLTLDLSQLKSEHSIEIKGIKSHEKISFDIFKHESRVKDTINKANMDYVKQRSEQNNWTDLAKAVGTLAGIAFTGYKLLSS